MLETLTKEHWEIYFNGIFKIQMNSKASLDVQLSKVTGHGLRTTLKREAYSLEFKGPLEPILEQRIYQISHTQMGQFEIFIVPVSRSADHIIYEAVFT